MEASVRALSVWVAVAVLSLAAARGAPARERPGAGFVFGGLCARVVV
jgi:hypothetical protein